LPKILALKVCALIVNDDAGGFKPINERLE
jgi:hypothetical protein